MRSWLMRIAVMALLLALPKLGIVQAAWGQDDGGPGVIIIDDGTGGGDDTGGTGDPPDDPGDPPDDPGDTPDDPDVDTDPDDGDADGSGQIPERLQTKAAELEVSEERLNTMRTEQGMGWGEMETSLGLAEKLVADSADGENPLTIDAALDQILQLREDGMGWGQIAREQGTTVGEIRGQGHAAQPEKASRHEKAERPAKAEKPERPERPEKPEKAERPERIGRPDNAGRPERVGRPDKPEKPSRPEKAERPAGVGNRK